VTRSIRFGIVFTDEATGPEFAELARRVEQDGFSTLLVADHLHNPMACGPLIMAAAAATSTLRVGSYVYNNDFRHPAVLAKEAATIDVLSGGRLELGIGAGWDRAEYDRAGMSFDPPRTRVDRLEEALDVIEGLLGGGPVVHEGVHYRIQAMVGEPRPVQERIPLLIGGGGPRLMRIAARRADIVGLVPQSLPDGGLDPGSHSSAAFDRRIATLDAEIAASGRQDGGPERSLLVFDLWERIEDVTDDGSSVDPELATDSPYVLVGDPSAMIETLRERQERWGISYFVCFASDPGADLFRDVVRRMTS
jgi:probable F420-dependent oxidoreductase